MLVMFCDRQVRFAKWFTESIIFRKFVTVTKFGVINHPITQKPLVHVATLRMPWLIFQIIGWLNEQIVTEEGKENCKRAQELGYIMPPE